MIKFYFHLYSLAKIFIRSDETLVTPVLIIKSRLRRCSVETLQPNKPNPVEVETVGAMISRIIELKGGC